MSAPCPTPSKRQYKTGSDARRAKRHLQALLGAHLEVYRCQCGWRHLTSCHPPKVVAVARARESRNPILPSPRKELSHGRGT